MEINAKQFAQLQASILLSNSYPNGTYDDFDWWDSEYPELAKKLFKLNKKMKMDR